MVKSIDWYFDFVSPFAYLQLSQLKTLENAGVQINYVPILFAALLDHWDNVGPAEVPPKRDFTYQYCYWLANRMGVPFKMPPSHPFNSLNALRLVIAKNNDPRLLEQIFSRIWRDGQEISSKQFWQELQQIVDQDIQELISDPDVKLQLRKNTEQAATQSVFGVPTLHIDGHNFWGVDAFEMATDYLRNPRWFNSEQYQKLVDWPVGVQRKSR